MHRTLFVVALGLLAPGIALAQITSVTPAIIGAGSRPTVTFVGATPGADHFVAFALTGACNANRVATTPLDSSPSVVLASPVPSPGNYVVCYTVDSGLNWVEQAGTSMLVVEATPSSVTEMDPSTIGAGSSPPITFTGVVPTPTTKIAFAAAGQCDVARLSETDVTSAGPVVMAPVANGGNYRLCYTVNAIEWHEQATPTVLVVEATPSSVTQVDPPAIGAGTSPPILFTGAVPTPTTKIAFAPAGQCSAGRVSEAFITSSAPVVMPPVASGGSYRVCYSVDNGTTWTQQTTPTMLVAEATPSSVTAMDPSTIGAGSSPPITFTGVVPTPTTKIAFALSGQCSTTRISETAVTDSAPVVMAPVANGGSYKVCYSVDNGTTWTQQTTPTMLVVEATPSSVTAVDPPAIGAGTQPTITVTGAVPTPTTKIAFALSGQCGTTRLAETDLTKAGPVVLGSAIADAGTYKLCYSVDGVTWTQQSAVTMVVFAPLSVPALGLPLAFVLCGALAGLGAMHLPRARRAD